MSGVEARTLAPPPAGAGATPSAAEREAGAGGTPAADAGARGARTFGRLLASELRLVLGRRRNLALGAALAAIPLLVGLAVFFFQGRVPAGHEIGIMSRITHDGVFLVFASMVACLPLFLPLAVSVVAGDAVAGEAGSGTLRYLLTVPVRRTPLLVAKWLACFVYILVVLAAMTAVGLVTGAALFGMDGMTLLSGDTVSIGAGLARTLGAVGWIGLSLTGLVTVGLFISTLTEVPMAAMAATAIVSVTSTVLDNLPQLDMIHPGLLTHYWMDFLGFLRLDVDMSAMWQGLAVQGAWVVIAGTLAWARFTTADISC